MANIMHIPRITAQTYRQALLLTTRTKYSSVFWITKCQRHKFWSVTLFFLVAKTSNFDYILHEKTTIGSAIFHTLPGKTLSPNCLFYPDAVYYTIEHILIRYQRVRHIWKIKFSIICLSSRELIAALYSLRPPSSTLFSLHITYLFESILESIWRYYWLYTIDRVHFVPLMSIVSLSIGTMLLPRE